VNLIGLRTLVFNTFEQGFLFTFLAFGVLMTFRFFRFPDLTAEGSYPLGGAVAATLLVAGMNPFTATFVAVLAGVAAGVITALIHTKLKINPIISGIITMTASYSVTLRVMGRSNMPLLRIDTSFDVIRNWVISTTGEGHVLASRSLLNIIVMFLLVAVVSAVYYWFLRTDIGLAVRATGQNESMIRGLGVNIDNTKIIGVGIANGLIALSGALVAQNHGFADVGMGIGVLVAGVGAVLIGESIFGARSVAWQIFASVVGMLVYRFLVALALRIGLKPTDLKLITATLVLLALAVPKWRQQLAR